MTGKLTTAERATIMDACQSISRSADALKKCHTVDGDWGDDVDAKAFYEAELRLLARLTALLAPTQQPSGEVPGGRTYPDEMSPALRDVLGRPNFWCGPIAHEMRAAGAEIKAKAEDEQAHVLHWLVKLVLDHGDDWQKHAATDLRAIREKADAARAQGGEQK
ncbi:hypothetical protein [Burkholderia ubonensis]|uniref:hypothetical protein n=1 Tax=Burkholderia ubonensis TaxID=101571 RepID=UPI000A96BC82|nr:hypothetical protein [Burkholderia ubonensis]